MSTWKCPNCRAVNPAPIHSHPEITCAACNQLFAAEYQAVPEPLPSLGKAVTVELTSKKYKQQQIICYILMLIGISGCVIGAPQNSGFLMSGGLGTFLIGAIWLLIVRVQIWWNHG